MLAPKARPVPVHAASPTPVRSYSPSWSPKVSRFVRDTSIAVGFGLIGIVALKASTSFAF